MAVARRSGGGRLVPWFNSRRNLNATAWLSGLQFSRRPDEFRYPISSDIVGRRRHLCTRPVGVRVEHASCRGNQYRRGHAARLTGRYHAAVDQLVGAQHCARIHRAGTQYATACADHFLVRRGASNPARATAKYPAAGRSVAECPRPVFAAASSATIARQRYGRSHWLCCWPYRLCGACRGVAFQWARNRSCWCRWEPCCSSWASITSNCPRCVASISQAASRWCRSWWHCVPASRSMALLSSPRSCAPPSCRCTKANAKQH